MFNSCEFNGDNDCSHAVQLCCIVLENVDVIAHKQPLFWRTYSTMHLKEMQENARCNSEVNEQHYWNIKTDIQY